MNKIILNKIFVSNKKLFIKTFGVLIIFCIGIYGFSQKVGKNDIKINYSIINDKQTKKTNIIQNNNKQNTNISINTNNKSNETIKLKEKSKTKISSDTIINQLFEENFNENHGVGDNLKYDDNLYQIICKDYNNICSTTIFNGNYTYKEKVIYQGIIIYLIRNIDKFLYTQNKIFDNIYSIKLNKTGDGRRGYAGHHSIYINLSTIKSNKEFKEVFTHELGHIIDLGVLNGFSNTKHSDFTEFGEETFSHDDPSIQYYSFSWKSEYIKKDLSSFKDFVSGYGLSDPFEDFAESVNLYINHYKIFEQMAQSNYIISQKFETMKSIFNNYYLFDDKKNLYKIQNDPDRRPWDTTKIK